MKSTEGFSFTVCPEEEGMRLDLFLVSHLPEYTRSALYRLVRDGSVRLDGNRTKAGYRLRAGEKITGVLPASKSSELLPEKVTFSLLHEDESILVLAKPPGVVVHPAAGHSSGTLAHGLLFHCAVLPGMAEGRPGIVHRLDKDTSGVMLVAKDDNALKELAAGFRNRKIRKTYHALLLRCPPENTGRIVAQIGRHPVNRKKMAVVNNRGRHAATSWRILESFANGMCLAEIDLETGRTHQIRVHMASIGCPVAGDPLYGGTVPASFGLRVDRQLLHASAICFEHPDTGESLTFSAPLWSDMQNILDTLRGREMRGQE